MIPQECGRGTLVGDSRERCALTPTLAHPSLCPGPAFFFISRRSGVGSLCLFCQPSQPWAPWPAAIKLVKATPLFSITRVCGLGLREWEV